MHLNLFSLFLSCLFSLVAAKDYNFYVVTIFAPGVNMGVQIGDKIEPLSNEKFPLFTGKVVADEITNYKYVALDEAGNVIDTESIERTYTEETAKTNEVYNRHNKSVTIPDLPRPFKNMFPMGTPKFKPFPKDIIYNVYANCDPEAYAYISNEPFITVESGVKPNNSLANCTISIVSPKKKYFKTEGSLHPIGYGSRVYKKLSWGLKFEDKFLGRKAVKLRAMAADPSFVREKLSTEIYKAVGVPVQEGTYARLIINNDVYGLYSIVDSFSKKWVGAYVHGDEEKEIGISYKMYTSVPNYPDFRYVGEDYTQYSRYQPDEYEDSQIDPEVEASKYEKIIEFTRLFDQWIQNYGEDMSETAVTELAKFLNIESVLRILVVDTLILALDNFWIRMSNASVYYDPDKNKYIILPYDFDKVLNGSSGDPMLDPENYIFDCFEWALQHEEQIEHFFTNHILNHPQIKQRYDVILAKASRETFAGDVVSQYIQACAELIREDVQWNYDSLEQLATTYDGQVNHYTYQDFENNIKDGAVLYKAGIVDNDSPFGVEQFVNERGNSCRTATQTVDLSSNENISDNDEVQAYIDDGSSTSSAFSITSKTSLLFVLSYFIFYLFF